ncbi:MAG: hypothetical protein K0R85_1400 [Devosia sp.]|nr:hypothetical protein [Devosia sp.]
MFGIDPSFFSSLLQVIMIDLVLAGDNAPPSCCRWAAAC